MSWFGEELVVFRSSFFGSGFGSLGTLWDRIASHEGEHSVNELLLSAGRFRCGMDRLGELADGIEGAFEADSLKGDIMEVGALLHESTHHVVGDEVDEQFLLDEVRALTTQDVETKMGLYLVEVEFNVPALGIECANGVGRVGLCVSERGGEDDLLGSEARDLYLEADESNLEFIGQPVVLLFAPGVGTLGLVPHHEPIAFAQGLARAEVDLPAGIEAHDRVDALALERSQGSVGTKAAVPEDNIATMKLGPHGAEEFNFVGMKITGGVLDQGATGQIKEAEQPHLGKTNSGLLAFGLGPDFLVLGGVGHRKSRAVDDLDFSTREPLLRAKHIAPHRQR